MRLFVTATNTSIGKTYTTLRLIELAAQKGLKPGCYKPIETGCDPIPHDGSKLLAKCQEFNKSFRNFSVEEIVPYRFSLPAAPFVAKNSSIDIGSILQKATELEKSCDILFIEGAGGLMVPIECNYFMIDLIKDLQAPALLVTPSRLGSINDTLLSRMALENRGIDYLWYINLYEDKEKFNSITAPYYEKCMGEVPTDLTLVFDRYLHRYLS